MTQKKIEHQALLISILFNALIAAAGFWVYTQTQIQALFLDFFFSFIALASSIAAIYISKISKHTTKSYPDGLYFLEPLYALVKSLLTLGLLGVSVVNTATSALDYFRFGRGDTLILGPVLPYAILMVIMCFTLSYFNMKQNKKIGGISMILEAESRTNFMDGLQSLGVGLAVGLLSLIPVDSSFGFLHYTGDFFMTLTLSMISIKQPISLLISSFKELSGSISLNPEIIERIRLILQKHLKGFAHISKIDIYKQGMKLKVFVYLDPSLIKTIEALPFKNTDLYQELNQYYEHINVVFAVLCSH
ncbi:hypothetical protein AOC36_01930 [Erysipelothrix larvae]|uniref:Cation efflux protein transmembrane domain-containing protein n=1 Tax=Erysipelothrix larvae TaxID=1514105 RepID=A0A0X8GYJ2_9FIRM|nr:cation transporter [Erysipelothrix larvae]AMC92785.1 hypothetical protein AOC36_01930 [Erysipelothrix larvae]